MYSGQGSLACCSPWDHKESDTTEQLNWTDNKFSISLKVKLIVKIWILFCEENEDLWRERGDRNISFTETNT